MVLLLGVQVSKLSLPLSCHPSLGLHDLLGFVGATRGLVSLGGIEVVEVCPRRASLVVEAVHGMLTRAVRDAAVYRKAARSELNVVVW